jgi:hypothetical protein
MGEMSSWEWATNPRTVEANFGVDADDTAHNPSWRRSRRSMGSPEASSWGHDQLIPTAPSVSPAAYVRSLWHRGRRARQVGGVAERRIKWPLGMHLADEIDEAPLRESA